VLVRAVRSTAELRRFIDLPYRLHRGDPMWVAPLRRDVRAILDRGKNPFFAHAEAEYFVAERDGAVVGRIAAIRNDAHGAFHPEERHVGFWGFFECVNDQAVADALFAAAAAWLTDRGLTTLRGPTSFSTNDECGLLVDGFDTPPAIMNPHNPRYYVDLVDRAGFVKAMDLVCYEGHDVDGPPERLREGARLMAQRKGVTVRTLDMRRFWEEVELVKQLYNAAWEKNWGFIPMTDAELNYLAHQLKPVVVPELVAFAERQGQLIGMAITIPDFNVALRYNPSGRLFPFGLFRLLWHQRRIRRVRGLTLGVLKEHRQTGADAVLVEHSWRVGRALGYNWGEASWLLETNYAIRNPMEKLGFRAYKTMRIYDRAL
jgi:GNAT superfamily N-acetyltransferase